MITHNPMHTAREMYPSIKGENPKCWSSDFIFVHIPRLAHSGLTCLKDCKTNKWVAAARLEVICTHKGGVGVGGATHDLLCSLEKREQRGLPDHSYTHCTISCYDLSAWTPFSHDHTFDMQSAKIPLHMPAAADHPADHPVTLSTTQFPAPGLPLPPRHRSATTQQSCRKRAACLESRSVH